MLGRDAVKVLVSCADQAIDKTGSLIDASEIKKNFRISRPVILVRRAVDWAMLDNDASKDTLEPDGPHPRVLCWRVIHHKAFEWGSIGLILVNLVVITVDFCLVDKSENEERAFLALNLTFIALYTMEAMAKFFALRLGYFKSKWNWLDLTILVLSYIDMIIELTRKDGSDSDNDFSPAMLRMARVFKLLRSLRGLRLAKQCLPSISSSVDRVINRRLWFAYDVGKGYVLAHDEAEAVLPTLVSHDGIVRSLLEQSEVQRHHMIQTLGKIQRSHPKIVCSIKTRQASRSILNSARDIVRTLKEDGSMDEVDANLLQHLCEVKMKRLEATGPCLDPPEPESLLKNLSWLQGVSDIDSIISLLTQNARLEKYTPGHQLGSVGDPSIGIYLVVSGMIRINFTNNGATFTDFIGAGKVIGEMGVLTSAPRSAAMTCDSDVTVYFIGKEDLLSTLQSFPLLEDKLWLVCGVRAAVTALKGLPLYQTFQS